MVTQSIERQCVRERPGDVRFELTEHTRQAVDDYVKWDGYDKTLRTGESRYGAGDVLAVPALRKDGATISVEFTVVPLKNEKEQMIGMIAVIRDVTKRFEEMRSLKRKLADATKVPG
jgi:PAS domain S-box-containing protein